MSPISARRAGPARRAGSSRACWLPTSPNIRWNILLRRRSPSTRPEYVQLLAGFYDEWAERLARLARAVDVVVLCEGDPYFYGSFMHLHTRLQGRVEIEVIAGIPGMVGCWNGVGQPIALGDDVTTVLMGTLAEDELERRMRDSDALVIMKTGRNLAKVRRALASAGRLDDAWLVERGTMPGERVVRLAEIDAADCPYFAIVLVHGKGRHPDAAE